MLGGLSTSFLVYTLHQFFLPPPAPIQGGDLLSLLPKGPVATDLSFSPLRSQMPDDHFNSLSTKSKNIATILRLEKRKKI